MPQPVQPPEIPVIIQPAISEESRQDASPNPAVFPQTQLPRGLATPTPPEIFSPESSALSVSTTADSLGPPISLSESQQPPRTPALLDERDSNTNPASVKRLLTQERGGEVREFELSVPTLETPPLPPQEVAPAPEADEATSQPPVTPAETAPPTTPFGAGGVIELTADRQDYDDERRIITAEGNVLLRFREALLNADRLQVNLPNRLVVAEGNVALTRGDQVIRGTRFEYYFVQDSGVVLNASGEINTPTAGSDLDLFSPVDSTATGVQRPVSDRITNAQPLQGVTASGGYSFSLGSRRSINNVAIERTGGTVSRLRYQADRVDFDGNGAVATNIRITNDPFSPPELELRAETATLTRVSPLVDEVVASRPRFVLDQGFSVPTFRNRLTIDRRERDPALLNFGFDDDDRGGLFVERSFQILSTPAVQFSIKPQYFLQRAVFDQGVVDPSAFGARAQLDAFLSPRTSLRGRVALTSFDLGDLEDELRASVRLQQIIGTGLPHTLNLEYSYRDRLFNGSLGFQTVQSSLGAVLSSPYILLGKTGVYLNYQAGVQFVEADTDRLDLLKPDRKNNRIDLARYQATASLSRSFTLWQGEALPATATEGLRYTSAPVLPNLQLTTGITGVASAYSNGDNQETLSGSIGLLGQLGNFSRPFFDYTGFNISYTQVARRNLSPFLFDRAADTSVLSGGITQQIYGPFRAGFQTSLNLNTGEEISTDFFLEYSRRTYNILLRYNPVLGLGSFSLRINDFNWTGEPGLFDGSEVRPVVEGVNQ